MPYYLPCWPDSIISLNIGKLMEKMILLHLLQKHEETVCFNCDEKIETVEELSIKHKQP